MSKESEKRGDTDAQEAVEPRPMAGQDRSDRIPPRTRGRTRVQARLSGLTQRVVLPFQRYVHAEEAAGFMLMLGAAIALIWANSPWGPQYLALREVTLTVDLVLLKVQKDLLHWVNDGLMVFFFLLVGLEIKREIAHGDLSTWKRASFPVFAAIGGMALPAGLYFVFNMKGEGARGWGIPVATDIAFALGMLALLGPRVPASLKTFLLAFATVDDIGGILIIAIFYTQKVLWLALFIGLGIVILLYVLRRFNWMGPGVYGLLGVLLWLAVLKSGVHATIAGVVLGLMMPARSFFKPGEFSQAAKELLDKLQEAEKQGRHDEVNALLGQLEEATKQTEEPLERLERPLRPWVSYVVLPVFALLNCGVVLTGKGLMEAATSPVAQGIVAGLIVGKLVGIFAAAQIAVRMGVSSLPKSVNWIHVAGASILAGIGFTVSLFIAELAFREEEMIKVAKTAILIASVVAAISGYLFLLFLAPKEGGAKSQ